MARLQGANETKTIENLEKESGDTFSKTEGLVVQQLSAEVAGKAQKYLRVGARGFVPFDKFEEVTIKNIKKACEKHFAHKVGKNVCYDVLTGEQGPSCKSVNHVPNSKLVHVRFIPRSSIDVVDDDVETDLGNTSSLPPAQLAVRKRKVESASTSSSIPEYKRPATSNASPSKCYPKSLSVFDMMKLGKIVDSRKTTVVHMYTFDIDLMTWSMSFWLKQTLWVKGDSLSAYKATTHNADFKRCSWVIKKYLPDAVDTNQATNHSLEDHNKVVVQMHMITRNFALQLKQEILKDAGKAEQYSPLLKYRKIFLGKTDEGETLTVEEFVSGEFVKYINNNDIPCVSGNVIGQKA
ncbi:transient receptor potential cation channel subfamily M member 6-like [Paramuricea clavata]|uniref:Transient receptor potential cation channel subfamily M member 6-like n=1 Tax=Paramuricea clavata TaxID=317549 RepID=A0A6S7IGP8_PARCT|nr:transient receptor potential cation channel subfamily M member 6-like [Paramuricea clavata]